MSATATTAAATATECLICFEGFNKVRRKPVTCAYCKQTICRTCSETYLLEDTASSARCMNTECRAEWSEDFLSASMTTTFLLGAYKQHRETVLVDLERARLPETQEDAQRMRDAAQVVEEVTARINVLQQEVDAIPAVQEKQRLYGVFKDTLKRTGGWTHETMTAYTFYKESKDRANEVSQDPMKRLNEMRGSADYWDARGLVNRRGRMRVATASSGPQQRNMRTFVMRCDQGTCLGFVGLDWVCGLCKTVYCKECREPNSVRRCPDPSQGEGCREPVVTTSTETTATTTVATHTCDPDRQATARALAHEAKPCPKCAAQISKIDGCDQMWCTQCQTAFSWRTGQIEESRVHNPHYFEWMRRNQQTIPAPGAGAGAGGAAAADCLTPRDILDNVLIHSRQRMRQHPLQGESPHAMLLGWVGMVRHIQGILRSEQANLRDLEDDDWRRRLRVEYLLQMITEEKWRINLQKGEKKMHRLRRVAQVLDVFVNAGVDILRGALPDDSDPVFTHIQLMELVAYCNKELAAIQSRYKNDVPHIDPTHYVNTLRHRDAILDAVMNAGATPILPAIDAAIDAAIGTVAAVVAVAPVQDH